jgi:hypothetical protein
VVLEQVKHPVMTDEQVTQLLELLAYPELQAHTFPDSAQFPAVLQVRQTVLELQVKQPGI